MTDCPPWSVLSEGIEGQLAIITKDIRLDNRDPKDWYPAAKRRQDTQDLVNRYYRQIRYGCSNSTCSTPTCLTYQKKYTKTPFRRHTVLSARALAHIWATEELPTQRLCKHMPDEMTEPLDVAFSLPSDRIPISLADAKLKTKDNKSLTQNLFDTRSLKYPKEAASMEKHGLYLRRLSRPILEAMVELRNITNGIDMPASGVVDYIEGPALSSSSFLATIDDKKSQFWNNFILRSITYVLSSPEALLESFTYSDPDDEVGRRIMEGDFREIRLLGLPPDLIFTALYTALEPVFLRETRFPHTNESFQSRRLRNFTPMSSLSQDGHYSKQSHEILVHDEDAAHLIIVALTALAVSVPRKGSFSWLLVTSYRQRGQYIPDKRIESREQRQTIIDVMAAYDDEMALRLMTRVVRVFASRCYRPLFTSEEIGHETVDQEAHCKSFLDPLTRSISSPGRPNWYPKVVLEWARAVMLKEWDGKGEFITTSSFGCAVCFMSFMHDHKSSFDLESEDFSAQFLSDRLDLDLAASWVSSRPPIGTAHILSYPFLFTSRALVSYFRAINYSVMFKAFDSAATMTSLTMKMIGTVRADGKQLFERLKIAITSYLVLEIRRDSILTDALNQLWRRQKRELERPLKIQMGMDEGEEGIDHGGVQQEFFRLALGEALNPDYGLFNVDDRTRMAWFRPCSLEPLYKFELLGLLTSLAIYNGLTLPLTFPLALYRKLLGLPVSSLEHIQDGWPDLRKGLKQLLDWAEGDVEDVFVRSYVFSFESVGDTTSVNMESHDRNEKWPPVDSKIRADRVKGKGKSAKSTVPNTVLTRSTSDNGSDEWEKLSASDLLPTESSSEQYSESNATSSRMHYTVTDARSQEPNMVTNSNREQYVDDYIFWLTDKSVRPQFEAFQRGFFVCLKRKALSLFSPGGLKKLVEGSQDIDLERLKMTTQYEGGFWPGHKVIRYFWEVLQTFSPIEVRKLLEFVTASDRIPVNGIESILFVVQRNGTGDERLPTSFTCYGRLLLPEYSSKEKLEERLRLAIDNNQGFGVA